MMKSSTVPATYIPIKPVRNDLWCPAMAIKDEDLRFFASFRRVMDYSEPAITSNCSDFLRVLFITKVTNWLFFGRSDDQNLFIVITPEGLGPRLRWTTIQDPSRPRIDRPRRARGMVHKFLTEFGLDLHCATFRSTAKAARFICRVKR